MATIHLAMDAAAGLTLPAGLIRGLSDSEQGLRDAGFAAATYTGARLTTLDDAAGDWNADVQPGWFLTERTSATDYALGQVIPATDLDDLREAVRAFQAQVIQWSMELNARAVGQPQAKVDQGHARLYSGLGAAYLICRDTARDVNDRKQFATLMAFGAADIRKPDDFYSQDTPTYAEPERGDATAQWHAWVNIEANPIAQVNLADSVAVVGNIATDVNLLADWAADLTG